ncbi:MAG: septum formation inhibitor Maf [Nitrospirae bacterium]|nr:septum formation inhibitor Maf [Nitrospirota bacterium]
MHRRKQIILASASPRRKELLLLTGLPFKIDPVNCEENMNICVSPRRLSRILSEKKARSAAGKYRDALIIAADTFIVFRERIMGKPHTPDEARKMLAALSGEVHTVITGFTVIDSRSGKRISRSVETKVYFDKLARKEINAYVRTGEPLDKAGAYAIQGLGSIFVRRIEGDYFNVIGLPLNALKSCLSKFGIGILHDFHKPLR